MTLPIEAAQDILERLQRDWDDLSDAEKYGGVDAALAQLDDVDVSEETDGDDSEDDESVGIGR